MLETAGQQNHDFPLQCRIIAEKQPFSPDDIPIYIQVEPYQLSLREKEQDCVSYGLESVVYTTPCSPYTNKDLAQPHAENN